MNADASNSIITEAAASGDRFDSLVAHLADDYLRRLDRGESPDVEEYLARWPGDARILRQTFASLRLARLSSLPVAAMAPEIAEGDRLLGDFKLLGELGRGGMGVVYEAEQVSLGRRVALKILPFAGVLDPRQLQRFKNEALAAAQLNHANIVDVIAVGCERGVHFYAMRLVDGPTLAEVIAVLSLAGGAVTSADRESTPVGSSDGEKVARRQADKEKVEIDARNPQSKIQNPNLLSLVCQPSRRANIIAVRHASWPRSL